MPPKADPRDWDRLFRPNAPRRGGPLRALANLLFVGAGVGIFVGGTFFALRYGLERTRDNNIATAQAVETNNAMVNGTRTAAAAIRAATGTAVAIRASTVVTATTATQSATTTTPTTVVAIIGRSKVLKGGNLRKSTVVSPATVIGQVCPGDSVEVLEQTTVGGARWYRLRVTQIVDVCTPTTPPQRVPANSLGWISSSLLAPLTKP